MSGFKKYIFLELARRVSREPHLARKLKRIGLALAALALVVMIGVGWLGFWAISTVTSTVANKVSAASLTASVPEKLISPECLSAAQNLLTLEAWLHQPLSTTFQKLRQGCWSESSTETI